MTHKIFWTLVITAALVAVLGLANLWLQKANAENQRGTSAQEGEALRARDAGLHEEIVRLREALASLQEASRAEAKTASAQAADLHREVSALSVQVSRLQTAMESQAPPPAAVPSYTPAREDHPEQLSGSEDGQ